jgi:hypothetical protein
MSLRVEPAMSAAPRLVLVAAACAASLPSPALASPFTESVETAVFSLCPGLRSDRISPDNPSELTRFGYFRTPEMEDDWSDVEDGAPYIFTRGRGAEAVTIAYWPFPELCSVGFGGRQAAAAAARVKARLVRESRLYRREPAGDRASDGGRRETWRVLRRNPLCLAIDTPARQGEPMSYEVSYEPLPPLHPGFAISACAPESGS